MKTFIEKEGDLHPIPSPRNSHPDHPRLHPRRISNERDLARIISTVPDFQERSQTVHERGPCIDTAVQMTQHDSY